jgi:hypothetical protein
MGSALLLACGILSARASFSDDFSGGLTGWTASGDVSVAEGEAVLGDAAAGLSYLYTLVPLEPGLYRLAVDVRPAVSGAIPTGTLPDVFFASVYFVDDPDFFDLPSNAADGAVALFDVAAPGFTLWTGALAPSDKGEDWVRYTGEFALAYAYAIPVFELNEENRIAGDSRVALDNLSVILVPEPASLAYLMAGIWACRMRYRRRRRWG